jgi:hypothetical protein
MKIEVFLQFVMENLCSRNRTFSTLLHLKQLHGNDISRPKTFTFGLKRLIFGLTWHDSNLQLVFGQYIHEKIKLHVHCVIY